MDAAPTGPSQKKDARNRSWKSKESIKWLDALQSVEEHLPDEQEAYIASDRESDVFAYIATPRRRTIHLLVRASQPRRVEVVGASTATGTPVCGRLFEILEDAPEVGRMTVTVGRKPGQKERETELSLRAIEVYIMPPVHRTSDTPDEKQRVCLIRAFEDHELAEGTEAVDWAIVCTDERQGIIDDGAGVLSHCGMEADNAGTSGPRST